MSVVWPLLHDLRTPGHCFFLKRRYIVGHGSSSSPEWVGDTRWPVFEQTHMIHTGHGSRYCMLHWHLHESLHDEDRYKSVLVVLCPLRGPNNLAKKTIRRAGLQQLAYGLVARRGREQQAGRHRLPTGTPARRALGLPAFVVSNQRNVG
jgi:hypothetical protein